MSALKGNKFLPVAVVAVLSISAYAFFFSGGNNAQSTTEGSTTGGQDVEETPKEEVELLAAQSQELKKNVSDLKEDLKTLIEKSSNKSSGGGINSDELTKLVDDRIGGLLSQSEIQPGNAPDVDSEPVFEIEPEQKVKDDADMSASNSNTGFESRFEVGSDKTSYQSGSTRWEIPVGYSKESDGVINSVKDEMSSWGEKGSSDNDGFQSGGRNESELKPYITIPSDSRIYDVQAATALVGRIEKNGENRAPWQFSATLSNDASLANGFSLPEAEEARVSGVAIGDMAGECVKGYITSITFIFPDGRIANSKGSISDPLARIADEYGNPCVPGIYFDNINEVIASQGTIAGLSSFASSIQKRQQSLESSATSQSLVLDGSESLAALGAVGSGGLNEASEILAEKYEAYYSFVYVEPGETITLLVDENIAIDYNEEGRKVRYEDTTEFSFN